MTLIDRIEEAGLFLIGEDSDYLGVDYAFLVSTKNRIAIYDGCEYAAFNKEEECIAVGSESGGSGMGQMGGWTWIRGVLDNRYVKSNIPPKNMVLTKLKYADMKIGCHPAY